MRPVGPAIGQQDTEAFEEAQGKDCRAMGTVAREEYIAHIFRYALCIDVRVFGCYIQTFICSY